MKILYKIRLQREPTVPGIRKFIAKVRAPGFIADAPRRKHTGTVRTPENIEAELLFTRIEHFTYQLTSNFAKRFRYDALQRSIGSSSS